MSGVFLLAVHLFLQLTVILLTCRLAGRLLRFLGQTQVVSEMIAGVALGPSLLGLLFPEVQQWLFPTKTPTGQVHPSMAILYALSQVGLVLYMFLVGLHLDKEALVKRSRAALIISLSGILVPAIMGGGLGLYLAGDTRLFQDHIVPWQAALFVASAMCITAFPMLARILTETGLARTPIGTLAIGAAAVDDAAAWCLLACVIASLQGSAKVAVLAIGGGALYALVMLRFAPPLLQWFARVTERENEVSTETIAVLMTLLMFCAWLTDYFGIYSIFGAFIAGLAMPRGRFSDEARRLIEPLTVSLLLPIFFVYSGLNTRLNLLVQPALLCITILTVVIAFLCKGGGCLLAAKMTGATWRDSTMLGVLMNARGLMELILVNIALERGLISAGLFTILVVMAIVTTLVASPLFYLIYRPQKQREQAAT